MATPATGEISVRWRAAASPGGLIGILAAVVCFMLAIGALLVLVGRASLPLPGAVPWVGFGLFLGLTLAFGYLVYGYLSIGYELGERSLVIRWAHRRYPIDLEQIAHIGPAIEVLDERPGRLHPFWPGYYVGLRRGSLGPVRVIATLPPRRQLVVSTGEQHFAISPERPVLFVEEYGRLRRALDLERSGAFPTVEAGAGAQRLADAGWTTQYPTITPEAKPTPSAPRRTRLARPPQIETAPELSPALRPTLLGDAMAIGLLALAVLVNVLMVVAILVRYESIPPAIALHWSAAGLPDRIGSPREIWTLPVITGIVTVANFVLAWSIVGFDRFAARLLLAATCIVQLGALVALAGLLT